MQNTGQKTPIVLVLSTSQTLNLVHNKETLSEIPGFAVPVKWVKSFVELQSDIQNELNLIGALCLDTDFKSDDLDWIKTYRWIFEKKPMLPVFLVHDESHDLALSAEEIEKIGIHKVISKKIPAIQILTAVTQWVSESKVIFSQQTQPIALQEGTEDDLFIGIRANEFLTKSQSRFDIYVRLSQNKYVKIIKKGDAITNEQLETYVQKVQLSQFFIPKEQRTIYLEMLEIYAHKTLSSPDSAFATRAKAVAHYASEAFNEFKKFGLTQETVDYANKFGELVSKWSVEFSRQSHPTLKQFFETSAIYEHSVVVAMLAGVLTRASRIFDANEIKAIGLAALFHDYALVTMPEAFEAEDETEMNFSEKIRYRQHPEVSARELTKLGGISADVLTIVSQHHIRLDQTGFPIFTATTQISRAAEIVGICDSVSRYLVKSYLHPDFDLVGTLNTKVFPGYSKPIVSLFKSVFIPKVESNQVAL